ncbi:peptidase T [Dubosiella muris]|uniref:Peptidase T n=1 Tax=Dubosiella muris TaxID=3038133 RepID=A0AC61R8U9_9FIRM|nr:peptidase T [Dubosiella muris]TGY66684.1 peptidase T [Dubosiella muris]
MSAADKLLNYVTFDTQSDENSETTPSTEKQRKLARALVKECQALGMDEVREKDGTVYATLEANTSEPRTPIGFVAHMDTASELSGANVKARRVERYDGGVIALNEQYAMDPATFPALKKVVGDDLIVTDGTTLLGADDKAGIAIIMQALEEIIRDDAPHGRIAVAFTPDEEIGRGVDHFDLSLFPVEYAYTVDGDRIDAVDYETFNAAQATVSIQGTSIHPGDAKDRMVNAALLAVEFASMLPEDQTPAKTEGREGFYHLVSMEGECESATLTYILREHDAEKFEKQIETIERVRDTLNEKYGDRIEVAVRRQYANMKDYMKGDMRAVERARKAIEKAGLEPVSIAVRGGTDGAMLTQRGLICPNLGTGSYNHHGRFEFASVQQMDRMVRIVRDIVEGE